MTGAIFGFKRVGSTNNESLTAKCDRREGANRCRVTNETAVSESNSSFLAPNSAVEGLIFGL